MNDWFLLPALGLFASLIALCPLGVQVLRRGVVFIDLAVAQAAAAAVIWSGVVLHQDSAWSLQLAGTLGALLLVGAVALMTRYWPQHREALIGLLYVACATLTLLGARLNPHGPAQLSELLAADILWINSTRVILLGLCALLVIGVQIFKPALFGQNRLFYPLFAIVASITVPALGLFLVFVCLIAPALWLERGSRWPVVSLLFIAASVLGLYLSWQADLPSGIILALVLAFTGMLSLLPPQQGKAHRESA